MFDKYPKVGQKFFAIFNDGSGGGLYIRLDNDLDGNMAFLNAEGDHCSELNMDDYLYWFEVPDKVKFWFEDKK
jgi:hypothetical protein